MTSFGASDYCCCNNPQLDKLIPQTQQDEQLCNYLQLIANMLLFQDIFSTRIPEYLPVLEKFFEVLFAKDSYIIPGSEAIVNHCYACSISLKPLQTSEGFAFLLRHRDLIYYDKPAAYYLKVARALAMHPNSDFQNIGNFMEIRWKIDCLTAQKNKIAEEIDHLIFALSYDDLSSIKQEKIAPYLEPIITYKEFIQQNKKKLFQSVPMTSLEDYYERRRVTQISYCHELPKLHKSYQMIRHQCHLLYAQIMNLMHATLQAMPKKKRIQAFKYLKQYDSDNRLPDSLDNLVVEKQIETEKLHQQAQKKYQDCRQLCNMIDLLLRPETEDTSKQDECLMSCKEYESIPDALKHDPIITAALKDKVGNEVPPKKEQRCHQKNKNKSPKTQKRTKQSQNFKHHKNPAQQTQVIEQQQSSSCSLNTNQEDNPALETKEAQPIQSDQNRADAESVKMQAMAACAAIIASQPGSAPEQQPIREITKTTTCKKIKKPASAKRTVAAVAPATSSSLQTNSALCELESEDHIIKSKTNATMTTIYDHNHDVELCLYVSQAHRRPVFSFIDYSDTIKLWFSNPKKSLFDKGYTNPESPRFRDNFSYDLPTSHPYSLRRLQLIHNFSKKVDAYIQRYGIMGEEYVVSNNQDTSNPIYEAVQSLTIPGHVYHRSTAVTEPCLFVYFYKEGYNFWFHRNIDFRTFANMTQEFCTNGYFKTPPIE